MTSSPVITVIVPIHNVAPYVHNCITSLRTQSFTNFEAIVIEDGSTDDSAARIHKAVADDPRFTVITQKNRGLSAARNLGLDRASGDFIAFLDGDDCFDVNFLQKTLKYIKRFDADWVACGFHNVFPNGIINTHSAIHSAPEIPPGPPRFWPLEDWTQVIAHFPSVWNKLFRRKLIEGLRFNEGCWFEDHAFFLHAAARSNKILHLPEPLYLQTRARPGQITATDSDRVFELFTVLDTLIPLLTKQTKPCGVAAMEILAHRLLHERSCQLHAPQRRARFLKTACAWLTRNNLPVTPPQGLWPSWALEMAGTCPLSIIIPWDGQDAPLRDTLRALSKQEQPGFETLIVTEDAATAQRAVKLAKAANLHGARGLVSDRAGMSAARDTGLAAARGEMIIFNDAGDCLMSHTFPFWTDEMLRKEADLGVSQFRTASQPDRVHQGFRNLGALALHTSDTGLMTLDDDQFLGVPHACRIIHRTLCTKNIAAKRILYFDRPGVETGTYSGTGSRLHPARRTGKTDPIYIGPPPRQDNYSMLVFSTKRPGHFRYKVEFSQDSYANISFFDTERSRILFHLSLRQDENLAVCNNRGRTTEDWGREKHRKVMLNPEGADVEIRFSPPHVHVFLDGKEIFGFGPRLLRAAQFPNLDQIRFVDFQGSIHPSTINMAQTPNAITENNFELSDRLELHGQFSLVRNADTLRLEIDGVPHPPHLIITNVTDHLIALRVVLPGRVWKDQNHDQPVVIRLYEGDKQLSQFEMVPTDLLPHIRTALAADSLGTDIFLTCQILEHTHFAKLAPELDVLARHTLREMADSLGLPWFQTADTDMGASLPLPLDPKDVALHAALAKAALTLNQLSGPDTLPDLMESLAPPTGNEFLFYIALTEPFCQHDAFDVLFAHVGKWHDYIVFEPGTNPWVNSGLLPYLLRSGQAERLQATLWQLVDDTENWIMHPPLAWTIRAALTDNDLDNRIREDLVYGFLAFLDRRMWDYWHRSPCVQMIETAAALVAALPQFSYYLRPEAERTLIRAYGLSPRFWDRLTAHGVLLSPQFDAARTACDTLRSDQAQDTDKAAALALFERLNSPGTDRFRRDLFGTGSLPGSRHTAPTTKDLMQAGLRVEEAALRYMAAPDTSPVGTDLEQITYTSLPEFNHPVTRSPELALQSTVSRKACTILEQMRKGDDPSDACKALLPDLTRLDRNRAQHIGAGVALSLLHGSLQTSAARSADCLKLWLKLALKKWNFGNSSGHIPAPVHLGIEALHQSPHIDDAKAQQVLKQIGCSDVIASPRSPAQGPTPQDACNPVFDTIVLVFSCQANLETRIPQMRAGWLSDLKDLGIPYLVVAGDGQDQIDGDILYLNAPDDYEGLPQKTLAALRWVYEQTGFSHLVKIDDDCLLAPKTYFHSLSYRKFDYYGRILKRVPGQMDRSWHNDKSTSARGRLELDKSPEPSTYCDGGSGYALSRRAIGAALEAAADPAGQALIQISFMEDKLLGDLLSLRGIHPSDEDYHISIRRRGHPKGLAVPRWLNGFDPSAIAPVKLTHLDDPDSQKAAFERLNRPVLWPKKIWPSYQDVTLGEQCNALEMVTGPERLSAARDAHVAVIATMRNEMFMLPHFLAHYRALGVESFLIADNCSSDGTAEYLADQPDVALFSVDTDYKLSHYGVAWQQALMSEFRTHRWSLVADADELLVWQQPQRQSLPDLLRDPAFEDADSARIFMLDLYPEASLETADFSRSEPFSIANYTDHTPFLRTSFGRGPYANAPTWTSAVRHRLIPGSRPELFVAQKIALLKYSPFMRLSDGLHYVAEAQLAEIELLFGHFKYNADFRRKALAEVARGQHFNNAEEYRKYLAILSEGREVVFDPRTSVRWTDAPFVRARLNRG